MDNSAGDTLVTYSYDSNGDLTSASVLQDAASNTWDTTDYTYVGGGGPQSHYITKITSPGGGTPLINEYDPATGALIASVDSSGNTITYKPVSGHTESITDANGNTTAYTYDSQGRIVSEIDPLGHQTTYVYGDSWTNNPTQVTTNAQNPALALTKTYTGMMPTGMYSPARMNSAT